MKGQIWVKLLIYFFVVSHKTLNIYLFLTKMAKFQRIIFTFNKIVDSLILNEFYKIFIMPATHFE
jgi:hypothetical protein